MNIDQMIKDEIEFCNEIELEKNEHSQFIYESKTGKSSINLPFILQEYKEWLIEKKKLHLRNKALEMLLNN
jgi:hypothetical protein